MNEVNETVVASGGADNVAMFFQQVEDERKAAEEKRTSQQKKSYVEYNVKNYLNLQLADGENERDVVLRPLPFDPEAPNGYVPFKKINSHMIRSIEGGKQKFRYFICNKHTDGIEHLGYGDRCPFCECLENSLKARREEKDEAKRKMYTEMIKACNLYPQWLMRVIDRNDEAYGPKIYRFNEVSKGEGTFQRLQKLWNNEQKTMKKYRGIDGYSIFNEENGKDIIFKLRRAFKVDGSSSTSIKDIEVADDETPISANPEIQTNWVNDTKKWYHLFPPKPFGYLYIKMIGGNPYLVPNTDIWSDKNEFDDIEKNGGRPVFNTETLHWEDELNGEGEHNSGEITEADFMQMQADVIAASEQPKPTQQVAEPVKNSPFPDDDIPF